MEHRSDKLQDLLNTALFNKMCEMAEWQDKEDEKRARRTLGRREKQVNWPGRLAFSFCVKIQRQIKLLADKTACR